MNSNKSPLLGIPTNIITGFLGVGKTSAILNLMKHKPADENWAILVKLALMEVYSKAIKPNNSKFLFAKYPVAACAVQLGYRCR